MAKALASLSQPGAYRRCSSRSLPKLSRSCAAVCSATSTTNWRWVGVPVVRGLHRETATTSRRKRGTANYLERLIRGYPIHPEVFDRL